MRQGSQVCCVYMRGRGLHESYLQQYLGTDTLEDEDGRLVHTLG